MKTFLKSKLLLPSSEIFFSHKRSAYSSLISSINSKIVLQSGNASSLFLFNFFRNFVISVLISGNLDPGKKNISLNTSHSINLFQLNNHTIKYNLFQWLIRSLLNNLTKLIPNSGKLFFQSCLKSTIGINIKISSIIYIPAFQDIIRVFFIIKVNILFLNFFYLLI